MGSASNNLWFSAGPILSQLDYWTSTTRQDNELFINPSKLKSLSPFLIHILFCSSNVTSPKVSGQLEQKKISPSLTNIL
ncbi:hypothetical protein ACN38_g931 [Penicillium nordicum]|uniref:Uncharacterized protein n=1 Tax=Penicillium nordicum TaxID=229535 RepID=A0A0M9WKB7_9EURO|nr:hypothetical protein ACN38_g931 [Penicillium nordicum]